MLATLLLSVDLLLVALLVWAVLLRRWRMLAGATIALAGSVPLLRLALAGQFGLAALFVLAATFALGAMLILPDVAVEWRKRP